MSSKAFLRAWLIATVIVAGATAQDADPKDILTKADKATLDLKAVSYKAEVWSEGGRDAARAGARMKATVVLKSDVEKLEDNLPKMRIDASAKTDRGEMEATVVSDGKGFLFVDKTKKVAKRLTNEQFGSDPQLQGGPLGAFMREFHHPRPFGDEINGKQKYEGKKTVNGVECHVIFVEYAVAQAQTARWYFGVKDNLPRRVDRSTGQGERITELSDLDAAPKLDDKTFSLAIPEGMEEDSPGLFPPGRKAPDFSLQTVDGKTVSLADMKGKTVVLAFWTSWNSPAKKSLPMVQKLADANKDKNVVVLSMHMWEEKDPAPFLKENNYTFMTAVKTDKVAEAYKVSEKLPAFYVIAPDGKVAYSATGFDADREAELTKAIAATAK